MINPKFNLNFNGFFHFNNETELEEYAIIQDNIIHFYNLDGETTKFGVGHQNNGYSIFNNDKTYIGHLETNSNNGYNLFDSSQDWIGFLA